MSQRVNSLDWRFGFVQTGVRSSITIFVKFGLVLLIRVSILVNFGVNGGLVLNASGSILVFFGSVVSKCIKSVVRFLYLF